MTPEEIKAHGKEGTLLSDAEGLWCPVCAERVYSWQQDAEDEVVDYSARPNGHRHFWVTTLYTFFPCGHSWRQTRRPVPLPPA